MFISISFLLFNICHVSMQWNTNDTTTEQNLVQINTTIPDTNTCPPSSRMTYEQMRLLLQQHPCVIFDDNNENSRRRVRRWGDSNKINAIHATINDHRNMINLLVNNSINATFVTDAIRDHHTGTPPVLTSWRDLFHIFFATVFIVYVIYYLIFRAGFAPCNRCLSFISKRCIPRTDQEKQMRQQIQEQIQKQLEQFQQQFQKLEQMKAGVHRSKKANYPSIPSITDDIAQYNKGYMSD